MSPVNIHDVFVPMYIRALQNTARKFDVPSSSTHYQRTELLDLRHDLASSDLITTLCPSFKLLSQFHANMTTDILKKGAAYTKANSIPETEVLNWRLAPDMNPLIFQIQNICNISLNLIVIILGTPLPPSRNSETSFADLQARIAATIELLQKTTREQFEGRDQASVTVRELGIRMKGIEVRFLFSSFVLAITSF